MKKLKVLFKVEMSGFVERVIDVPDDFNRDNLDEPGSRDLKLLNDAEEDVLSTVDAWDLDEAVADIVDIKDGP